MTVPRSFRWLAALAVGAALVVVPAAAAQAHDVLRSTDPADGSTVDVAPDSVLLTFDQPALALGTELVVTAPDGRDVASGAPVLVDTTVRQAVSGPLPAGRYTVEWRVTSADGHPVSGSFTFTAARAAAGVAPAVSPTPAPSPSPKPGAGGGGAVPVGGLAAALVVAAVAVGVWIARSGRRRGGPSV